jgi:hypothetical protein
MPWGSLSNLELEFGGDRARHQRSGRAPRRDQFVDRAGDHGQLPRPFDLLTCPIDGFEGFGEGSLDFKMVEIYKRAARLAKSNCHGRYISK